MEKSQQSRHRCLCLITPLLLVVSISELYAQPRPINARRNVRPTVPEGVLPAVIASLPGNTRIAFYSPRLVSLLDDLDRAIQTMSIIDPSLNKKTVANSIIAALGRGPLIIDPIGEEHTQALLTERGLTAAGIEPRAPITIVPSVDGSVVVFIFGLKNRPTFEDWLSEIAPDRRRKNIDGESASILGPESDLPITCLARQKRAFCQVGVARGADAFIPLRQILAAQEPRLERNKGVVRAFRALPQSARYYALIDVNSLGALMGNLWMKRVERKFRFEDPNVRRRARTRARAKAEWIRRSAALFEGAAMGVYPEEGNLRVRMEMGISPRGRRLLRDLNPHPSGEQIRRWVETPALVRVLAELRPEHVKQLASAIGFDFPPKTMLNGTVAFLMLGLDAECSMAKRKRFTHPTDWTLMLPSAFAVGLSPTSASLVHEHYLRTLPLKKRTVPSAARAPLHGAAHGSPVEVHVLDNMVLVGTGPGSGAAALRRLRTEHRVAPKDRPFFHADVQLRAIDAAFASGAFTKAHRRELLMLEALRLRVKPLLDQVGSVSLTARASEASRRVRVDFQLSR